MEFEEQKRTAPAASTMLDGHAPADERQDAPLGTLANLLDPLDTGLFFREYWNEKALYMEGDSDKFRGLFDRQAFDRCVHHCADLKVGYTDEKGWPAHFNIKPEQIPAMLASGKTICASIIDSGDPALTAFLSNFRRDFSVLGRFFFNSYLSGDGSGFGLHLDHHPVVILQIEGRKRWWYSPQPALESVITNISFPAGRQSLKLPWVTVSRPAEESLREVVLSPGDVLYLPKGSWHRAQAVGGSLALTLAMESASPLDLIQMTLAPALKKVELLNALPGFSAGLTDEQIARELQPVFEKALNALRGVVDCLTTEDLFRIWRSAQPAFSDSPLVKKAPEISKLS